MKRAASQRLAPEPAACVRVVAGSVLSVLDQLVAAPSMPREWDETVWAALRSQLSDLAHADRALGEAPWLSATAERAALLAFCVSVDVGRIREAPKCGIRGAYGNVCILAPHEGCRHYDKVEGEFYLDEYDGDDPLYYLDGDADDAT